MAIKDDLRDGETGEALFQKILLNAGIKSEKNTVKATRQFWDIHFLLEDKEYKAEVKYDLMAAKTGNIAIEIFNSRKLMPSGLTATTSHLWVIILSETEIYVTTVDTLKKFTEDNKPLKFIEKGGDGNATLLIFKKKDILPIFHNIYSLSSIELSLLLKDLLNGSR